MFRPWIRCRALTLGLVLLSLAATLSTAQKEDRTQTRPAGAKVPVPAEQIQTDDGDTVTIDWGNGDREVVRILGIDTPETAHPEHNIPFEQPFGAEARGFCAGAFATARSVELLRAAMKDPYGRTLGYLFVDGKNYSEAVLLAGLAVESVSRYGDNGFPEEAKLMLAAAAKAGPVPFEDPHEYRARMRRVSDAAKATTP